MLQKIKAIIHCYKISTCTKFTKFYSRGIVIGSLKSYQYTYLFHPTHTSHLIVMKKGILVPKITTCQWGGKPPPLLVPGLGKTLQRSPVMQRKDTVSTAATVWAGQSGLLKGGAQSLVGKTQLTEVRVDQAVKSRGYARQSYRLYHKKLLGLLVHLDIDDTSTSVKHPSNYSVNCS